MDCKHWAYAVVTNLVVESVNYTVRSSCGILLVCFK